MQERNEFDARARGWDDESRNVRAQEVAAAIAAAVPELPRARVLEYGAGTGLLAFALRGRAAHVTLADSSREMLAVAREKIAAAGAADLSALPLDLTVDAPPAERFDVICSLLVLHHVRDTAALLRTFHRMLPPGGALCISDLDAEDGSFHGNDDHFHDGFDRAALGRLLEAAGFREVRFETVGRVEKPPRSGRYYPLFLATARKG